MVTYFIWKSKRLDVRFSELNRWGWRVENIGTQNRNYVFNSSVLIMSIDLFVTCLYLPVQSTISAYQAIHQMHMHKYLLDMQM